MEKILLAFSVTNKQTAAKSNNNNKKSCRVVVRITDIIGETYTTVASLFTTILVR